MQFSLTYLPVILTVVGAVPTDSIPLGSDHGMANMTEYAPQDQQLHEIRNVIKLEAVSRILKFLDVLEFYLDYPRSNNWARGSHDTSDESNKSNQDEASLERKNHLRDWLDPGSVVSNGTNLALTTDNRLSESNRIHDIIWYIFVVLYNAILRSSPGFAAIVRYIQSVDFRNLLNNFKSIKFGTYFIDYLVFFYYVIRVIRSY